MKPLVLASASAARANLLSGAAIEFEPSPAVLDEEAFRLEWKQKGGAPAELASALARAKARKVAAQWPGQVVLGCDQILLLGDEPIGKSASRSEARALLRRLRGRTHTLVTAAALATATELLWQHTQICRLAMRDFSDSFLEEYISAAGDALTCCVGCYQLEGLGIQLFERVEGDYFSILGLPLLPLLGELRRLGQVRS